MGREIVATTTSQVAEADKPLTPQQVVELREFLQDARADNTRRAYARAWDTFAAWCTKEGRQAAPAAPATVALWVKAACNGEPGVRPLARSTINQALAAIALAHHQAGLVFDRKHPIIAEAWRSASRRKARSETVRQAQPITSEGLRTILADLGTHAERLPADARDAALLALGWSAALRRSELIGLDWDKVSTGLGCLRLDDRGLVVTLNTSKGSQTEAATVVVPCPDMPIACAAVKAWVSVAGLQPGDPIFRPIDKGQHIGMGRLTGNSVSRIIKTRVRAHLLASGRDKDEAEAIAAAVSGHSMRAGYATAAAAVDVPSYRIQQHTRHKSAEMVARYVREADKWTKSGLRGVGF
jgi:integrase